MAFLLAYAAFSLSMKYTTTMTATMAMTAPLVMMSVFWVVASILYEEFGDFQAYDERYEDEEEYSESEEERLGVVHFVH